MRLNVGDSIDCGLPALRVWDPRRLMRSPPFIGRSRSHAIEVGIGVFWQVCGGSCARSGMLPSSSAHCVPRTVRIFGGCLTCAIEVRSAMAATDNDD